MKFYSLFISMVAITLFIGGIVLLLSHAPFWSIYFGVPSVQVGIILLILAFEKLSKESVEQDLRLQKRRIHGNVNNEEENY